MIIDDMDFKTICLRFYYDNMMRVMIRNIDEELTEDLYGIILIFCPKLTSPNSNPQQTTTQSVSEHGLDD